MRKIIRSIITYFYRCISVGIFVGLSIFSLTSCVKTPYSYYQPEQQPAPDIQEQKAEEPSQVERGTPYAFLDNFSSYTIGLFSKLILWNMSIDNHEISPETEDAIKIYLTKNNLSNVKVRLNQYEPLGEWDRLWENDSVGLGWRATIGVIASLFYTVLPGRFFGGDNYNPYTDTISIYSDHPAVALHEGGHAKDLAQREWKGSYAFFNALPLVCLFSESEASGDALGYLEDNQCKKDEQAAYKVLYPAYSTYIGGQFSMLAPTTTVSALITVAVVIPAHIVGRIKANNIESETDACMLKP